MKIIIVGAGAVGSYLAERFSSEGQDLVVIESEKVTPVIDGTYELSDLPEAIGHVGERHTRGKTVIIV